MISCHLRDIGGYLVTVGYVAIMKNNHVVIYKWRPGGILYVDGDRLTYVDPIRVD